MELAYLKTANNMIMWISCIPPVALVIYQAWIFARRAWVTGPKIGVTVEQMKIGIKSSFVASLGPSIVIVIGAVSLLASVGGPLAWMRLAYIGSVMYELPAADRAATAAGSQLGTSNMTMEAFANAAWIMCTCCLGWIIVSALFTDKMGVFRDKIAGGNMGALSAIASGGGLGAFSYQCWTRALAITPGNFTLFNFKNPQLWSLMAGMVTMLAIGSYAKKSNAKWAKQFGMTIAMVVGMCVGAIFM